MQKNAHGLLCSLMQQLLSHDASHIDHVLSHYNFATSMDTVADCDVRQLREFLSAVLKRDDQPMCIFPDGLDEVADKDEPDNLFSVVDSLISYNKVKLCVASRPEPVFHRHLSRYPSLKLHRITREEMRNYADDTLCRFQNNPQYTASFLRNMADSLVSKADGVFV